MMKELSIEEKAKRYDEVINEIKNLRDILLENGVINENGVIYDNFNRIFPELRESEDERIRKALINGFKDYKGWDEEWFDGITVREAIAWLEKQGNNNMGISETTKKKLEDNLNKALEKETPESWNKFLEKQSEQKPVDIRTTGYWHVEDTEQKSSWSEEDENNILFLTSIIEECFKDKEKITLCGDTVCANFTKEDVINRLKSLKERYTWKPSDEQMEALKSACGGNYVKLGILESLYVDLKKLREE